MALMTEIKSISIKNPQKSRCGDTSCSILLEKSQTELLVISDGVSTAPKDYLASATVCRAITDYLKDITNININELESAVSYANEVIKKGDDDTKGMMATLSLVAYDRTTQRFMAVNIGDSRIYGLKGNSLELLSKDDVKRIPFMENGKIKLNKGVPIFVSGLSKAMGDLDLEVNAFELDPQPYSAFVLLTDGVYNIPNFETLVITSLSEVEINKTVKKLAGALIEIIEDDASMAVIRWKSSKTEDIIKQILAGESTRDEYPLLDVKLCIKETIEIGIANKDHNYINKTIEYMTTQNFAFERELMISWLNNIIQIPGCAVQKLSSIIRKQ